MMASKASSPDLSDDVFDSVLDGLNGEVMSSEWEIADIRDVNEDNADVEEWAGNVLE